jgi:hypothetical protein
MCELSREFFKELFIEAGKGHFKVTNGHKKVTLPTK